MEFTKTMCFVFKHQFLSSWPILSNTWRLAHKTELCIIWASLLEIVAIKKKKKMLISYAVLLLFYSGYMQLSIWKLYLVISDSWDGVLTITFFWQKHATCHTVLTVISQNNIKQYGYIIFHSDYNFSKLNNPFKCLAAQLSSLWNTYIINITTLKWPCQKILVICWQWLTVLHKYWTTVLAAWIMCNENDKQISHTTNAG